MKKIIIKVNELLIKKFGIPKRNARNPSVLDTLIGTILSQNTNDNNSFKAYQNLKNNFKDWNEAAKLSAAKIEDQIRIAGLGKQKSNAIKKILNELENTESLFLPDAIPQMSNQDALEALTKYEGVGLKTASCVLLFALDRNVCPVDTHVHRTLNRIGIVKTTSPDKTALVINKNLPEGVAHSFHTNLINLGRDICRPSKPNCSICPLVKVCKYDDKNLTEISEYKRNKFLLLDNL